MKKPILPSRYSKLPNKTLKVKKTFKVDNNSLEAVVNAYSENIAHASPMSEVTIDYGFRNEIILNWIEEHTNKFYEDELRLYNLAIEKYNSDMKNFNDYISRKKNKEKEDLDSQILRLRERLTRLENERDQFGKENKSERSS